MVSGDNYRIIEGYQSLHITNIKVNYGIPQTAEVSGTINYINGQGEFSATMEKVNGSWMVLGFNYRRYYPTPT
ncbi:MAG: hypothetical protein C3F13_07195 [Anaerolineales bacterium]|nr:MAG: hypothetical protein C3F13_07195 [Anaerolineales bacterium]